MTDDHDPQSNPLPDDRSAQSPHGEEAWDLLAIRFLDGEESAELMSAVRQLLPNPKFRQRLALHSIESACLFEFCGRLESCTSPEAFEEAMAEPFVAASNVVARPAPRRETGTTVGRLGQMGLLASVIATVVMIAVYFQRLEPAITVVGESVPSPPVVVCSIDEPVGRVFLGTGRAGVSDTLADGQSIRTEGALSSVRLTFADGTAVQLAGDTFATFQDTGGQKQIFLDYGNAAASVRPQPQGKPLELHTPTAVLEVIGTEFAVSAKSETTELSVSEGVVVMKPRSGGEPVQVVDGETAEARLAELLPPYQSVLAPHAWREQFTGGLPDGWVQGTWFAGGPGEGFVGAVAATKLLARGVPNAARGHAHEQHFTVHSAERWANGLVRVQEDTQLTYRIKMDRPEWYQVFLCVRAEPEADSAWSWNYEYQELPADDWQSIKPGIWRTVRVPLSQFKRAAAGPPDMQYDPFELRGGVPPPVGGLVAWVMITSQEHDHGMMIDDIAIGPNGELLDGRGDPER